MTVDIQKIIKTDQDHFVHPQFHPNDHKQPFVWVSGEGARMRTADGKEFIDGLACLWNVTLGHGRKELAQAAARQMEQLAFTTSYIGHTNIPAVQLTEKLSKQANVLCDICAPIEVPAPYSTVAWTSLRSSINS